MVKDEKSQYCSYLGFQKNFSHFAWIEVNEMKPRGILCSRRSFFSYPPSKLNKTLSTFQQNYIVFFRIQQVIMVFCNNNRIPQYKIIFNKKFMKFCPFQMMNYSVKFLSQISNSSKKNGFDLFKFKFESEIEKCKISILQLPST